MNTSLHRSVFNWLFFNFLTESQGCMIGINALSTRLQYTRRKIIAYVANQPTLLHPRSVTRCVDLNSLFVSTGHWRTINIIHHFALS